MKSEARVVVIGGGVNGVSVLYHLAKKGWTDVVLLERTELTAGSTWHAAGLLPLFNMSYSVGQLHQYSVELYKTLEKETGQDVGFHVNGNLRLATNRDRMDEYRSYQCTAETIGVDCHLIGVDEIKKLWPLCKHGRSGGRALASDRRTHRPGRCHHGHGTRRPQHGRGDSPADRSDGNRALRIARVDRQDGARETSAVSTSCARPAITPARPRAGVGLEIPSVPVEHQLHRHRRGA